MQSRSALPALALFASLLLASSSALACERHQNHQASIAAATPVEQPAAPAQSEPQGSTILVSPAAEAAMSVTEALGSEPVDMRCPRMRKREQALTQ